MTNKSLIFAGIFAAILGNNAFATGENTVTSKSYVDAMDATKQDKITAKTSGNVVTYNGTGANGQTQFDERGIFDYDTGWDYENQEVADGHEGDLLTAGDVIPDITSINNDIKNFNDDISNINDNISNVNNQIISIASQPLTPVTVQLPLTCANANDGCTLWQIGGTDVAHKLTSCTTATVATDCPACVSGTIKTCTNNVCACTEDSGLPVVAACVAGRSCNTNADCGSGGTCSGGGESLGRCQCGKI